MVPPIETNFSFLNRVADLGVVSAPARVKQLEEGTKVRKLVQVGVLNLDLKVVRPHSVFVFLSEVFIILSKECIIH